jgi:hypothetical protein
MQQIGVLLALLSADMRDVLVRLRRHLDRISLALVPEGFSSCFHPREVLRIKPRMVLQINGYGGLLASQTVAGFCCEAPAGPRELRGFHRGELNVLIVVGT